MDRRSFLLRALAGVGVLSLGRLPAAPAAAEATLAYPEGSFLFLDGGTLELGIVRDSVLNSTNEYQIFGESLESLELVASGGLIAPGAPYYSLASGRIGRPVRDALPAFGADRAGVKYR